MFTVASRSHDDARRMALFACQYQGFGQIMGVLLFRSWTSPEVDKSFEHISFHAVHIADHSIGDDAVVKAGGQGSVTRKDVRFGRGGLESPPCCTIPPPQDEAGLRAHTPRHGPCLSQSNGRRE